MTGFGIGRIVQQQDHAFVRIILKRGRQQRLANDGDFFLVRWNEDGHGRCRFANKRNGRIHPEPLVSVGPGQPSEARHLVTEVAVDQKPSERAE